MSIETRPKLLSLGSAKAQTRAVSDTGLMEQVPVFLYEPAGVSAG
ncbi:hypothetical protein [Brevundimonas nasdae]|nr:hypothetical protein [Brevundimonas nasdae]